jgi:hypothetical protein
MSSAPIKSIMPIVINLGAVKAEVDAAIDLRCIRCDDMPVTSADARAAGIMLEDFMELQGWTMHDGYRLCPICSALQMDPPTCARTDQERAVAWRAEAFEANPSLYGAADGIDLDMCDMAATRHVLRSVAGPRVTDATDRDREEFWGAA